MKFAHLITTAAVLGLTAFPAWSEESPFTQGLVEAVGLGTVDSKKAANPVQARILAKRAAIVDAQRNLLESIEGVRVTSGTTVKDAQLESDVVANRVKGLLKGAFIVKEDIQSMEGTWLAEVTMGVCLNAALTECRGRPNLSQIVYESLPKTPPEAMFTPEVEPAAAPSAAATAAAPAHSGLIVDLTDMDFSPYFDVRLVTDKGKEVYGPGHFNPVSGTDWLHWEKSMAAAEQSSLVGAAPLIVSPEGTTLDSDVILSSEDAEKLYLANREGGDFLASGKVIFVLN